MTFLYVIRYPDGTALGFGYGKHTHFGDRGAYKYGSRLIAMRAAVQAGLSDPRVVRIICRPRCSKCGH